MVGLHDTAKYNSNNDKLLACYFQSMTLYPLASCLHNLLSVNVELGQVFDAQATTAQDGCIP